MLNEICSARITNPRERLSRFFYAMKGWKKIKLVYLLKSLGGKAVQSHRYLCIGVLL